MRSCFALILLVAVQMTAADLSGKWSGSFKAEGADQSIPQLIILTQRGTTLSGSAGPNAGEQYPLENGKIEGKKASFQVTTGEWKFTYDLTLANDSLSGDLKLQSTSESRTGRVTLTRVKEN